MPPTPIRHVYICYDSFDRGYVRRLAAHLHVCGIPAWFDPDPPTSERFEQLTSHRIDACLAFLVVMSPSAAQSSWVANEINFAKARSKHIMPLLLTGEPFVGLFHLKADDVRGGRMPGPQVVGQLLRMVKRGF